MEQSTLNGKTIENSYYREEEGEFVIEFTDGTRLLISSGLCNEIITKIEID